MGGLNARQLQRVLAPLWRRLRLLVSRGEVRRTDDARRLRRVQINLLRGETAEMEHAEPYGYTARPLPGAEAIAAAVGGARSHLVALLTPDRRYRPTDLQDGEVCLYTDEGDQIRLKRGRVIGVYAGAAIEANAPSIKATCQTATVTASESVTLDAPDTEITGNALIGGNVQIGGSLTVAGLIAGQGGIAVSGGTGAAIEGAFEVTGGDVIADGISLKTHVHGDVAAGTDTTGGPQ